RPLLDVLGSYWAQDNAGNLSTARNISREILAPFFPPALNWSFTISNDTIYNSSGLGGAIAAAVSRRAASGFSKNQPSTGYISRAFLENAVGNRLSKYFFFGGFVGQGNVTASIYGIPDDANVSEIYIELNAGENFSLYVNGIICNSSMIVTSGNFTVNNWTTASPFCLINVHGGMANNFTLNFTGGNLTNEYIGGGYLRVTYNTSDLLQDDGGLFYYRFPGINGLINLYDSIYVPGNITAINANVTFFTDTNYTTRLAIGNTTIINHTGVNSTVTVSVNNTQFTQLFAADNITFINLSGVTTPLRMFVEANITGGLLNGTVDIVLITDTSGSMAWRMDSDSTTGSLADITNCSDPNIYQPNARRISLARCLDKWFANALLGGNESECTIGVPTPGNRVALVDYSTSVKTWTALSIDLPYLTSVINAYQPTSSTCIACAINKAYEILASQSNANRSKYIVVMTDGQANVRATPVCNYDMNDVDDLGIAVGESGGTHTRTPPWQYANLGGAADAFNRVSVLNSSIARAAADGGEIYRWNGTDWLLETDTGSNNVYGIDVYNETFGFAVGASAKIWRWNGAAWSETYDAGSFNFRGVKILNRTWAYAVGDGGLVYYWNGASWALHQDVTTSSVNLYAVDGLNATQGGPLAFAVGTSGKIYLWTGGTWAENTDTGSNIHYDVSILNATKAFTASNDGRVYEWNGAAWTSTLLSTASLNGVHAYNATLAYAVGYTYGNNLNDVYEWNGAAWARTYSDFYYAGNLTTGRSCNDDDDCLLGIDESYPALNANYSAYRAFRDLTNMTVDSVGFATAACPMGNDTVTEIARAGNGSSYSSSNATELRDIYCQMANNILTRTTPTQQVVSQGNLSASMLSPESYIEFRYTPAVEPSGYQEITINAETDRFAGCDGSFFIPPGITVTNALRTSYSGYYWTKSMSLANLTSAYQTVFNLSRYNSTYTYLGDPYQVYLPATLLQANDTYTVNNTLGLNSSYSSPNCSAYDRVIYSARLRGYAPYGDVFNETQGRNVTVYYDSNHDGTADGFVYVAYGTGLANYNATPVTVDQLSVIPPYGNSLDAAFLSLLDQINYVIVPSNSGRSGENTNPIDIILSSNVRVETDSLAFVPFIWGPVEMGVSVWV
ncbi:MAG: vWA domain-containing protein, partial [Candidatus Micrarchaeota archaeon]